MPHDCSAMWATTRCQALFQLSASICWKCVSFAITIEISEYTSRNSRLEISAVGVYVHTYARNGSKHDVRVNPRDRQHAIPKSTMQRHD